jgi:hypothetical protein
MYRNEANKNNATKGIAWMIFEDFRVRKPSPIMENKMT